MRILLIFYVLLYASFVSASSASSGKLPAKTMYQNIRRVLDLPLENRRQVLSGGHKPQIFRILKFMAFSDQELLPTRWAALITLAYIAGEDARPVVLSALQHPRWFLRNAGLLAMEKIDPATSLWWGDKLLDDPALLVRTASVDLIGRQKADTYKWRLLKKLNAPDSFYKNQSLWIRHHIMRALADFATPGEEKFFLSVLHDPDTRLYPPALSALKKLTGYSVLHTEEMDRAVWRDKWLYGWLQFRKPAVL